MSDEPTPAETPPVLPVLSLPERRVLGVLVEKAKTTPDAYPLSLNALVTGCNQKSNREPVLNLSDLDVEDALTAAQKKGLVLKVTGLSGSRVERWRHNLYDSWRVNKVELAVLAELLLRGPQTEGELRGRASRMESIDDLDALRSVMRLLAERRLVVYLTPEGRRGTVVTHGFHPPNELERLRATTQEVEPPAPAAPAPPAARPTPAPAPAPAARPAGDAAIQALETRLAEARAEITALRAAVTALQGTVSDLAGQLRGLKDALGA
jgi:uncharacterized protein YceH (UPF0502 family)